MSEFVGKTINEYQLIETLAENDDMVVIKAFQPSMNRYVAMSVLKPHLAKDLTTQTGFLQSAQLSMQLLHPNILPVYDSGQAQGIVFKVSPFLEGGTLGANLTWFHDLNQAAELFRQLTSGLEYIHSLGYIHGNLKSFNILLDPDHRPSLSDIGFTHFTSISPSPYMSPEQVQGGIVDQRSDVYALGILLYEVLVGGAPPAGMVVSPRAMRPDIPEAVERVILKAIAQNPEFRFQKVSEFLVAFQDAVQTPGVQPAPLPPTTPYVSQSVSVESPKAKTNWLAIILGILILALLCVGGYFGVQYLMEAQETEVIQPPAVEPTEIPQEQPTQAPGERPTRPPLDRPTRPPQDLPTGEPPQAVQPLPPDSPELPDQCTSLGMTSLVVIMGVAWRYNRRRHDHQR